MTGFTALIAAQTAAALPVFPGAEGFGSTTVAGRGGTVYRVTNLNDDGVGSLRAALSAAGPRVVVFEVAGTIVLARHLAITQPYVTIAGQTAPAPGITLRGAGISVQTHNVLIQHLHIRPGDDAAGETPGNRDAVQALGPAYNVVIDHCSLTWALDENASAWYEPHDVTFSNNLIAEALDDSLNPAGPHSKGLLIGQNSRNVAVLRNVFAHNVDRNPFLKDGTSVVMANNVVYNWVKSVRAALLGSTDLTDAPITASIVGNVFTRGPDTPATAYAIAVDTSADAGTKLYKSDNQINGVTAYLNWAPFDPLVGSAPIWTSPLTKLSSSNVEAAVLASAGAWPGQRDAIDARIVTDIQNRAGRIIDSQDEVGGWLSVPATTRALTLPASPGGDTDGDGYTNLEEWLHDFAQQVEGTGSAPTASLSASPATITQGQSSTLTWSTNDADSVSISPTLGTVGTSGSQSVAPSSTTTYTLAASNTTGTTTKTATVTVSASANAAPVLSVIGSRTVVAGTLLTITVSATDPNGQALIYSATGLPAGAVWSGLTFTWTPTAEQIGAHEVTFSVSDGSLSDSETVAITVQPPASAEPITLSGTIRNNAGAPMAGVLVRLPKVGTYPDGRATDALTDAQGQFVLDNLETVTQIREAIDDCRATGECDVLSKRLTPVLSGWTFKDPATGKAYRVVRIDTADPGAATDTGITFAGTPR